MYKTEKTSRTSMLYLYVELGGDGAHNVLRSTGVPARVPGTDRPQAEGRTRVPKREILLEPNHLYLLYFISILFSLFMVR